MFYRRPERKRERERMEIDSPSGGAIDSFVIEGGESRPRATPSLFFDDTTTL